MACLQYYAITSTSPDWDNLLIIMNSFVPHYFGLHTIGTPSTATRLSITNVIICTVSAPAWLTIVIIAWLQPIHFFRFPLPTSTIPTMLTNWSSLYYLHIHRLLWFSCRIICQLYMQPFLCRPMHMCPISTPVITIDAMWHQLDFMYVVSAVSLCQMFFTCCW